MNMTFGNTYSFFLMNMKKHKLKFFEKFISTILSDNHDVNVIEMNWLAGIYFILIVQNIVENLCFFNF